MASYTVALNELGVHKTLVASTVDTVTITNPAIRSDTAMFEVVNRDGTAEIYWTIDGSTPIVGGNNTYVLPATIGAFSKRSVYPLITIKLISSGTPAYSVLLEPV